MMINITLPDQSIRSFDKPISGAEIAASISPRLLKDSLFMKVDAQDKDLAHIIKEDASVQLITRQNPEALEIIRHDAAHVIAEAVKELFPETQVTIGPAIENGFYYDFYREKPFTPDDLVLIEERMREIVDRNEPIIREEWDRNKAIAFFKEQGEFFKAEIIADLPEDNIISLYRQGAFIDLCRGPHLPSTGALGKAFKLMKVAGAYWRGDSKNPVLQRIYGTAFANDKQLKEYLVFLEEAEKRDHRRLGKELNLFHMQDEAPGCVFWHPKGWTIYKTLQQLIREHLEKADYVEINTPMIMDRSLWEASGHWEKFQHEMFTIESEKRTFGVKPMSCPGAIQVFKQGLKSYKQLPLRLSEFGMCHRHEPSGALHGLMRVRAMTQDDAHIFCTPSQILDETKAFCNLLRKVYAEFGFADFLVRFSDRPENRAGEDAIWDLAEDALKKAVEACEIPFVHNPGEGAFYGPKLEFVLKDAIGRSWQCGTLQLDFILPQRLGASYIDEKGERQVPVLLHRAILGSLERFTGILIEHYAGKFPLWIAPTQLVIASLTDDSQGYAEQIFQKAKALGLRVISDLRSEKINYKVREHSLGKVPYIFVVGKREEENNTVSIRTLGSPNQEIMSLENALEKLCEEIKTRKT
jgi:threonyl-tRNA synthetase